MVLQSVSIFHKLSKIHESLSQLRLGWAEEEIQRVETSFYFENWDQVSSEVPVF